MGFLPGEKTAIEGRLGEVKGEYRVAETGEIDLASMKKTQFLCWKKTNKMKLKILLILVLFSSDLSNNV